MKIAFLISLLSVLCAAKYHPHADWFHIFHRHYIHMERFADPKCHKDRIDREPVITNHCHHIKHGSFEHARFYLPPYLPRTGYPKPDAPTMRVACNITVYGSEDCRVPQLGRFEIKAPPRKTSETECTGTDTEKGDKWESRYGQSIFPECWREPVPREALDEEG